jgi:hypothetical protein
MRRAVVAGVVGFGAMFAAVAWSGAPARIPIPAADHTVTIEDAAGVVIEVRRATFDGEVFFYGDLGEAQVTVPFERLRELRVEPSDVVGKVVLFGVLKDGTTVRMLSDDDKPCYGEASFGNYRIEVGKLRRVTF